MEPIHIAQACTFHPDKFLPTLLYGTEGARVFLLCLEAGQHLPVRPDPEEVLCYLLEGEAEFVLGERIIALAAGDLIGAGPGETRGMKARTRIVALWIHICERPAAQPAGRPDERD
jgi:quercetin dioxygenase-like cupin family protein